MKNSSLSLTALLLSLTALLLSALLLTSCETKEAKGTSPKARLGKAQTLNSLPHAYGSPLEEFIHLPVKG
jgi:predicted small secreted protein